MAQFESDNFMIRDQLRENVLKMMKVLPLCFAATIFLSGCVSVSGAYSQYITYSAAEAERDNHYGYVEFYSPSLFLNDSQLITADLTYNIGNIGDGSYREKRIVISDLHEKNGTVAIFLPKKEGWSINTFELITNYGELRILSSKSEIGFCEKNTRNKEALKLQQDGHDLTVTPHFSDDGWHFCGVMLKSRVN